MRFAITLQNYFRAPTPNP